MSHGFPTVSTVSAQGLQQGPRDGPRQEAQDPGGSPGLTRPGGVSGRVGAPHRSRGTRATWKQRPRRAGVTGCGLTQPGQVGHGGGRDDAGPPEGRVCPAGHSSPAGQECLWEPLRQHLGKTTDTQQERAAPPKEKTHQVQRSEEQSSFFISPISAK